MKQKTIRGSPAHAGIDLYRDLFQALARWFPRTRGDRPYYLRKSFPDARVPPHTRG